ncbi:MAG: hypothetical protein IJY42_01365, partial [Clostridia bacterium]|nr:hypothetical protein [Clostridia bacterium]
MKITPVLYGRTTLPESEIFAGGNRERRRPILLQIHLIETEGRRILVDAGCVTMSGFTVEDHI